MGMHLELTDVSDGTIERHCRAARRLSALKDQTIRAVTS